MVFESLRAELESDLSDTLENEWGMPVVLIAPDGTQYATSANDPTGATSLAGQVLYDQVRMTPEGNVVVVNEPVVTLRLSSLSRVPLANENWILQMPISPLTGAPLVSFLLSHTRAPERLGSIGVIKLFPQIAVPVLPLDPAMAWTDAQVDPVELAMSPPVPAGPQGIWNMSTADPLPLAVRAP